MAKPAGGTYPERLTIICPRGPGGGSHQVATAVASAVEHVTGVPVEVVARAGREGLEAIEFYMREVPPNGRVILQHVDDAASLYVAKATTVSPLKEMHPVLVAQTTYSNLYVRANDERFADWESFAKHFGGDSKTKLRIAMTGHASSLEAHYVRLIESALDRRVAIEMKPFEGLGSRLAALREGEADALIEQPGDVRASKELKAIRKLPEADDEIDLFRFRAFFVHGKTDQARLQYLEEAFHKAAQLPSFKKFQKETSFPIHGEPLSEGADSARSWIKRQIEQYQRLLEQKK